MIGSFPQLGQPQGVQQMPFAQPMAATGSNPLSGASPFAFAQNANTAGMQPQALGGGIGELMGALSMMMGSLMLMVGSLLQGILSGAISGQAPARSSAATPTGTGSGNTASTSTNADSSGGSAPSGGTSSGGDQGVTPSGKNLKGITPNQFQLGDPQQSSMCGIVAAKAFANAAGKDISVAGIKDAAVKNNWWDFDTGMHGPDTEVALLKNIGLNVHQETDIDWKKVAATVQSGKPVIINTPNHYFVAEGYDPATGKFDFGNSARIMKKSGGNTMYTPEELSATFGSGYTPRSSIYLDQ